MSLTVQQVFDAALNWSSANTDAFAAASTREILERVNKAEQSLFTRLAQENRYFYAAIATFPSSGGASGRTVDLSTKTPPIERLLLVVLPSGEEVSQVDAQDLEAELPPRYIMRGQILTEVGNDWSAAAGAVTLTIDYVYRPAELSLAGALTQTVSVPDRFASYLEVDLAAYFAHKDFGRSGTDPGEIQRLAGELDRIYEDITTHLDHFGGTQARRFHLPVPQPGEKA